MTRVVRKACSFSLPLVAAVAWSCLVLTAAPLAAAESAPAKLGASDLMELSIEDLMSIEVTSLARKPEKLSDTSAAVFVITQDDIRRSGVTSIPEALRLAPGIQVAKLSQSRWAISARGFNGRFANKLLVMIDGRTVYSPTTNGVFWELQDVVMEDIDRIEVIRGPGGSLWGANAVKIQDLHFHDLRHTFATRLQGLGVDYEVRQTLLGHRMPGMTADYSHGGPAWDQKLREAVVRLDQAFKMSYGLSYERPSVAVDDPNLLNYGEPAGARTRDPRLKS